MLRLKDSLGKLCGVIPVLRRVADEILGPFFSTKNIGSHMDCHRFFYIPFITAYQHTYVRMLPMHARTDRPRYLPIFLSACIHIFLHTYMHTYIPTICYENTFNNRQDRQDKTCVIIQSDFVFAKMYNSTHLQTLQILPIWDPQTFPVVMRHPTMLWWRNLFHNAFRFLHSNLFQKKHKNVFFSTYYKSFYFLWCIVSTYNLPSSLCNTSETGEGFSGPRPVVNRGDAKDLPCTWFRLKRS